MWKNARIKKEKAKGDDKIKEKMIKFMNEGYKKKFLNTNCQIKR